MKICYSCVLFCKYLSVSQTNKPSPVGARYKTLVKGGAGFEFFFGLVKFAEHPTLQLCNLGMYTNTHMSLHDSCLSLCAARGGGGGDGAPRPQRASRPITCWSPWFPPSAWWSWWYTAWPKSSETLWPASSSLSTTTRTPWPSASHRSALHCLRTVLTL